MQESGPKPLSTRRPCAVAMVGSEDEADAPEYLKRCARALEPIVDSGAVGHARGRNARGVEARGIAEDAPGRIPAVEEIVDAGEDLEVFAGLVRGVQVDDRIPRDRRQLVGLIPDVEEAAEVIQLRAHRPVR